MLLLLSLACDGPRSTDPPPASTPTGRWSPVAPDGEWVPFDGNPCRAVGAGGTVDVTAVAADGTRTLVFPDAPVDGMSVDRVHVPSDARLQVPSGSRLEAALRTPGEPFPGDCPTGNQILMTFH